MSSDNPEQEKGELLKDTTNPESAADAADDTQAPEKPEGEQKQEGLDLADPVKPDPEKETPEKGVEQKLKTVETYQARIDNGEIKLSDIPADQSWVVKHLRTKPELDKEAVRDVLNEERDKVRFHDLKLDLEAADLSTEKITLINEKYKYFRTKQLSKIDALTAAMDIAQVDLQQEAIDVKRSKMTLPKPGGKSYGKNYEQIYADLPFAEAQKLIPAKELDKILRNSMKPTG
ncbi:MAG: hypothetical protein KAS32_27545 [Candidatus Peribacteraceae bacterium]|nr:hypothetical protein [Candidatus Peribacteraceae bacterium]